MKTKKRVVAVSSHLGHGIGLILILIIMGSSILTFVNGTPSVSSVTSYFDPFWQSRGGGGRAWMSNNFTESQIFDTTPLPSDQVNSDTDDESETMELPKVNLSDGQDDLQIEIPPNGETASVNGLRVGHAKLKRKGLPSNRNKNILRRRLGLVNLQEGNIAGNISLAQIRRNLKRRKLRRRRLTRIQRLIDRYFKPDRVVQPGELTSLELLPLDSENEPEVTESPSEAEEDEEEEAETNENLPIPASLNSHDSLQVEIPEPEVEVADSDTKGSESSEKIIIFERGQPKIQQGLRRMRRRRRRKRKNKEKPDVKDEIEGEQEEQDLDLSDLHSSESFNPFLNSSTPIENDLRNSQFYNLQLLHPLFNSDTSLRDPIKVPENKTIDIIHKLSDHQSVSVQVAPDLHDEEEKGHSLLGHDSIISSHYGHHNVYKNRPRVQVSHSVSVSTSHGSGHLNDIKSTTTKKPVTTKITTRPPLTTIKTTTRSPVTTTTTTRSPETTTMKLRVITMPHPSMMNVTTYKPNIPIIYMSMGTRPSSLPKTTLTLAREKATTTTTTEKPEIVTSATIRRKRPFTLRPKVSSTWSSTPRSASRPEKRPPTILYTRPTTTEVPTKTTEVPVKVTTTKKLFRPTEKIKPSNDPPLIMLPPFGNDRTEPNLVTLTTQKPTTTSTSLRTTQKSTTQSSETILLQQLLADLGVDLADAADISAVSSPEVSKPPPILRTTTTTPKPTTVATTTIRTTTVDPTNDLLHLFNLISPQQSSPSQSNSNADLLSLLSLLQPSGGQGHNHGHGQVSQVTTTVSPNNNDILNLLNLFQPQPTTQSPAKSQTQGQSSANDLLNILNFFQQQQPVPTPPPPPPPPQTTRSTTTTTTTTTTPKTTTTSTTTPAPVNEILSLLNLLQGSGQVKTTPPSDPKNAQAELEALVQQALLQSLGLSSQASNLSPTKSSNGLSDADLKTIYAAIDQQGQGSSTTTTTTPPSNSGTLTPALRNMLSLFGVSHTTASPPVQQQQQQQLQQQQALDLQTLLAHSLLSHGGLTKPKGRPEVSESNLLNIFSQLATPNTRPQKPSGLYYWVDLNAFMGEPGTSPRDGLRPKLGNKNQFVKVK